MLTRYIQQEDLHKLQLYDEAAVDSWNQNPQQNFCQSLPTCSLFVDQHRQCRHQS